MKGGNYNESDVVKLTNLGFTSDQILILHRINNIVPFKRIESAIKSGQTPIEFTENVKQYLQELDIGDDATDKEYDTENDEDEEEEDDQGL